MNKEMDDDHPHKNKKMRTTSSMNHHHHLFDLLPEEVIIDQILLKLPREALFDVDVDEQAVIINPFDLLPEDVIIDQLLLKLPVESLLRLRCVSKCLHSLITSPSFVQFHTQQLATAAAHDSDLILFSTRAPLVGRIVKDEYADYLVRNYICKFSAADGRDTSRPVVVEMNCPFPSTDIRASCNGLLYVHGRPFCTMKSSPGHCFSQGYVHTASNKVTIRISPSYIWNPCTKEYREIPPPPTSTLLKDQKVVYFDDLWHQRATATAHSNCNSAGFCGFGYDIANNEYKILYYEHLSSKCNLSSAPATEFKIYTLGTNTWTSISDNPYRSLFFGHQWLRIGLFVNGALHWIMSSSDVSSRCATKAKIISFDIEKEVFQEMQKPPLLPEAENLYGNLQMLKGCLCVCQFPKRNSMEEVDIWMLKDYAAKDSWTKFLRVEIDPGNPYNYFKKEVLSIGGFKLLRYCENGEIAMLTNSKSLVLYYPYYPIVTPAEKFIKEDVKGSWEYQMNFRKSLASLNSGTYTR